MADWDLQKERERLVALIEAFAPYDAAEMPDWALLEALRNVNVRLRIRNNGPKGSRNRPMKRTKKYLPLLLVFLLLGACCPGILVTSSPPGAHVVLDGQLIGVTPCSIDPSAARTCSGLLEFEKGSAKASHQMRRVRLGGTLRILYLVWIDTSSEGWDRSPIHVELQK